VAAAPKERCAALHTVKERRCQGRQRGLGALCGSLGDRDLHIVLLAQLDERSTVARVERLDGLVGARLQGCTKHDLEGVGPVPGARRGEETGLSLSGPSRKVGKIAKGWSLARASLLLPSAAFRAPSWRPAAALVRPALTR
jgi:hypothetical protein